MTRPTPVAIANPALPLADPADRATFTARKLEHLRWERDVLSPGALALAQVAKDNADDAFVSATSAATSATATAANVALMATYANAPAWVSGATYSIGDVRYSPADQRLYRRITAGAGTTDPSADTTNWQAISAPPLSFRNVIINGDMRIDQRNNGAAVANSGGGFVTDMFQFFQNIGVGGLTGQQVVDAPSGFKYSLKFTVVSHSAPAVSDAYIAFQKIEGQNLTNFKLGTASASPIAISVWVKSSVAGTYPVYLQNGAENRSYVATITVTTSWAKQTVLISAGDITGTWATDTTAGLIFGIDLGSGSNFNTTAGAWQAGKFYRTAGSISFQSQSVGSTFQITGLQVEASANVTEFEQRPIAYDLTLCRRCCRKLSANDVYLVATGMSIGSNYPFYPIVFDTPMRASPSCTFSGSASDYWVQWSAGTSTPSSIPVWNATGVFGGYITAAGSYGSMTAGSTSILLLNNSTKLGGMVWEANM